MVKRNLFAMTELEKKKHMQAFMVHSFMILEHLDALVVTQPKMIEYKNNITNFVEELGGFVSDTHAIQNSTYFWDLSKRFKYSIDKFFQDI